MNLSIYDQDELQKISRVLDLQEQRSTVKPEQGKRHDDLPEPPRYAPNESGICMPTKLTADQAHKRLLDVYNPVFGQERRELERYINLLCNAEVTQITKRLQFMNPKAAAKDKDWIEIHQLIEDRAFAAVPADIRAELAELETTLTQKGVLNA